MKIAFIDIQNFRKLRCVRIELADRKTVFVGANNSGKTTAMHALDKFLKQPKERKEVVSDEETPNKWFVVEDFTLSLWEKINKIGADWEQAALGSELPSDLSAWGPLLPSLDIWLDVKNNEYHYVHKLIPTLDWQGGYLGVRLRLQPKDIGTLCKDYIASRLAAKHRFDRAVAKRKPGGTGQQAEDHDNPPSGSPYIEKAFWPKDMRDFLSRRLEQYFAVRYYELDPSLVLEGTPQELPSFSFPKIGDPFAGLIRIDPINAQRGLDDADSFSKKQRLASQFSEYFKTHLNPEKKIEPSDSDIDAIVATCRSEALFDKSLEESFKNPIKELESLNYPGVNNPTIKVQTKIQAKSALNHAASVQYCLNSDRVDQDNFLPESYNGLGYQNLIFMVFKLMRARDGWMRVNREVNSGLGSPSHIKEPIHLVFVEEPEAHLHAQVQQVFIRKAYDVLRNHDDLRSKPQFRTQLIVSTHSSHIAHECEFSELRYFQRVQSDAACSIPESRVISLATVFSTKEEQSSQRTVAPASDGELDEESSSELETASVQENETEKRKNATRRFVTRYLQATHCDLFFADAVIMIEGAGERMLVPHFLKKFKEGDLFRCYIALLEISGSHAFRLKELIDHLGLTTLIITDIDACILRPSKNNPARTSWQSCPVEIGKGQKTCNSTLKKWIPAIESIDDLLALSVEQKEVGLSLPNSGVRVAFQTPITLTCNGHDAVVYPRTFEDSFLLSNYSVINDIHFDDLDTDDYVQLPLVKKECVDSVNREQLAINLYNVIMDNKDFKKAEFALEVLFRFDPSEIVIPNYILEGLEWLHGRLITC